MPLKIAFTGVAGAGKDTAAQIMTEHYPTSVLSFAHPLKNMLKVGLGWNDEHVHGYLKEVVDPVYGFTPRKAMQTLGTEWRNTLDKNLWLNVMKKQYADVLESPYSYLAFTDCRFDHEAHWLKSYGFKIIHIVGRATENVSKHVSESGITVPPDYTVANTGTLEEFSTTLQSIFQNLEENPSRNIT